MRSFIIHPLLVDRLVRKGWFNCEITIQDLTDTPDSEGTIARTPSTFATTLAAIRPLSGTELVMAQREQAEINHRITMPFLASVKTRMRILFGARVFEILVVRNPAEQNLLAVLDCVELFELPAT